MADIIITGASGFIGSNLARRLSKSKHNINLFIRKGTNLWRLKDIVSDFKLHIVELNSFEDVKKKIAKIEPDVVFHLASYGVYPFQKNLIETIQTNIIGTINLIEAIRENGNIKKFVNIGSSSEYPIKKVPLKESDALKPTTPYSITKTAQTHFAQYFGNQYKLPITTLRLFTAYGMYEQSGRLVADIMLSIVKKQPLQLSTLKSRRDFVFIGDVVDALEKVSRVKTENGEVFNIGGGKEYSVEQIVNLVAKITNMNPEIVIDESKKRQFDKSGPNRFADLKKSKKILDWKPTHSIEEGLLKTFEWYKQNVHLYH